MKRTLTALLVCSGASILLAAPAAAQPVSEPASCQGYLASWANPNEAFIIHELVQPKAAELGVTVGKVLSPLAKTRAGSLDACIPE